VANGIVRKDCLSKGSSVVYVYSRRSGIVRKEWKGLDGGDICASRTWVHGITTQKPTNVHRDESLKTCV
jgi:hypothetical protein